MRMGVGFDREHGIHGGLAGSDEQFGRHGRQGRRRSGVAIAMKHE